MTAPRIETASLTDRTVLFVQTDMDGAGPLQGRIVQAGGNVMVADSLPRALLIARNAALNDAVIDIDFAGSSEIIDVLRKRHISYIFYSAASLRGIAVTHAVLANVAKH